MLHFFTPNCLMMDILQALNTLYDKIPRRYSVDNIKEIQTVVLQYEQILMAIEAINSQYEKGITNYFNDIEVITNLVKQANSNKASKKAKDDFFNEASTAFKNSVEAVTICYKEGQ